MKKIEQIISNISDSELIILSNDIYDWGQGNGDIDKQSNLFKMFQSNIEAFHDIYFLRDLLVSESLRRFHKVAKMLILKQPGVFIK